MTPILRPRIYVAGPISKGDLSANLDQGIQAGLTLLDAGYAPFIPHLSSYADGCTLGSARYERWLDLDFSFITTCHAVLRLPGESAGADREVGYATNWGIPVYYSVEEVQKNVPTWCGDPRFHNLLQTIGRLHDRKQMDYGSKTDPFANVRASIEWGMRPWVGCLLRLGDKYRRLQRYAERGTLANEGAEDSMLDIAVYALIALVLYKEEKPSTSPSA